MPERPVYLDKTDAFLQRVTEPQQQPVSSSSADHVDRMQALQKHVATLEAAAKEREAELHSAKQDVESLQVCSSRNLLDRIFTGASLILQILGGLS